MTTYDFSTGELADDPICRHCGCYVNAPTATPEYKVPAVWHGEARCVEGEEPIR